MQHPTTRTPVSKCLRLARYSTTLLARFVESPVLVEAGRDLGGAADTLAQSNAAAAAAAVDLVGARASATHAELRARKEVRRLKKRAEISGEGGAALAAEIFKDGIAPFARAKGATLVELLRGIEVRLALAAPKWSAAAEHAATIASLRVGCQAANEARRAAHQSVADQRARRDRDRQAFVEAYARAAGHVHAAFPNDRATRNFFFDTVRTRAEEDDELPSDEAVSTAAQPTPAPA